MIYAICNPTAGSGRGEKIGQQIKQALDKKGVISHLVLTKRPGHAEELARGAREEGVETVLSIGGDGTSQEVARGLLGGKTSLGVIPAGTGNDFVKTIGLPAQPLDALDYILSHPARPTDAGEVNGKLFLNVIGTGFDVSVLQYAQKAKKFCRGLLPYLYGVLQTLFRFHSIPITYTTDDGREETREAFIAALGNGGVFGGGIRIAPEARADDGLLYLVIVDQIQRRLLIPRLVGLLQGRILTFPETHYCRVSSVRISAPGTQLEVDGEIIPEHTAAARVLPDALLIHR